MRYPFLFFIIVLTIVKAIAQSPCPSTISVGTSCSGHSCTSSSIQVVNFNTYTANVLTNEWGQWGAWPNGMNSLNAGAVAIRSYAINRINNPISNHVGFNICNTTSCHVYNHSIIPSSYATNAVSNTANNIITNNSGNAQLAEYAAETNDNCSPIQTSGNYCGQCGNGKFQRSITGPPINGGACYPTSGTDPVCSGFANSGHPRGMCQRGSIRWATGYTVPNNSNIGNPHSHGTRTWQQLIAYYYPYWNLTTCSSIPSSSPLCNNDNSCSPTPPTLTINTGGNCINTDCSTINATSQSPDIPFSNGTNNNCSAVYQSSRNDDDVWFRITPSSNSPITIRVTPTSNTSNFDPVIGLYQGNCSNPSQVACADAHSTGITENIQYTPTSGTTYLIRVFSYGTSSTNSGNFQICVFSSSSSGCTPVAITSQPTNQTGNVGGTVSFSVSASGTPPYSYFWYKNNVFLTSTTNSTANTNTYTTPSLTSNDNGDCYYVLITNCSSMNQAASDTACVNVNSPCPTPPAPVNITGSTTVCSNTSHTYSINPVTGATSYTWSYSGSGNPVGSGTSITLSPTSSGTLSVMATNSCGSSPQTTLSISVNPLPIQPGTISGSSGVCSGALETYSINPVPNATSYTWQVPSGWSVNSTTNSMQTTVGANSGNITVTADNSCGSSNPSSSFQVSVNSSPTISINPPSATICSVGNGVQLQASGTAQNYTWSPSTGLNATTGPTVTANPTSNTTYTVTGINGGCTATSQVAVTISNQANAVIYPNNPVMCSNSSITLSTTSGSSYAWSGPNGYASSSQVITVNTPGNYAVTVTNPGGCNGTANTSVNVIQSPALVVNAGTNQVIGVGGSATLGGSPVATGGTAPYTYEWTPTSGLNDPNLPNPLATPSANTTYSVLVTDANGCSESATVSVTISGSTNCAISINPNPITVSASQGTHQINLTIDPGCPWTVIENCNWLVFTNTIGNGPSTLNFTVDQNSLVTSRTCLVNINGTIVAITQNPCTAPSVDFTASVQAGIIPFSVNFNDNSTNSPTSWQWTFPGGTPSTSTLQNPTVIYNSGGIYDVTLKASNQCGNNVITKLNYIGALSTSNENSNLDIQNLLIFPNPTQGQFTISGEVLSNENINLELISTLGQVVFTRILTPQANRINEIIKVDNLSSGSYILKLKANEQNAYFKFMIE